jgi:RimJ/RimL family protein N-acetyltransferase
MIPLVTGRLILRAWREEDRVPFAALNADPEVMRFFPNPLTRDESDALFERLAGLYAAAGMTLFATEEQASGRFIGLIGLMPVRADLPLAPAVEIAWRLARDVWGRSYATEGARAALRLAFDDLALEEVVAMATPLNVASLRVMEKIGLARDASADFDHPTIAADSPLRRHVVYRLRRTEWSRSLWAAMARA